MKLKQACYDPAFCRMNVKRFAPASILYALVLVLLTLSNVNLGENMYGNILSSLYSLFQFTLLLNFAYAFILAQLLLGDLYNPKLCYAIHSMPVTRGGWFGTQVIHGIFSVVPGILISGGMMAISMTRFRVLIPIWMGVAMLEYLFFLGLSFLCGVLSGNRFGMTALYGLTNFFGIVIYWIRIGILSPLIYGMYLPEAKMTLCPISGMIQKDVFTYEYQKIVARDLIDGPMAFFNCDNVAEMTIQRGAIVNVLCYAIAGCVLIYLAMKLLNKRKPEAAGDFLAFRKLEPVMLVLCTISAGVFFHAVSDTFGWSIGYVMLFLGLLLGYYGCLMFLKRQVNVFSAKSFLPLLAMSALVLLSLTATGLDLFGITYRVPEMDQIESASVRVPIGYFDTFTPEDAAGIEDILTLQRDALEEHRQREQRRPLLERIFGDEGQEIEFTDADGNTERAGWMYITYQLKNGSTISRSYLYHETSPHLNILQSVYSRPEFVFSDYGFDVSSEADVRKMMEEAALVQLHCGHANEGVRGYWQDTIVRIYQEDWSSLLDAMLEDSRAGKLSQSQMFHPDLGFMDSISIIYPARYYDGMTDLNIQIYGDSENTMNWLIDHGYHDALPD